MPNITTAITEIKAKVSMQEWQQRIHDCQTSGMSVKSWCHANGISPGSYYFHMRKIRESVLVENQIIPLEKPKPVPTDSIRIETDRITITFPETMPLYRLEKDFAAKGANISRTTMANWIIMASQLWVKPVWEQMHRELVTSGVIHADETVVQVLNEPGKKPKTDSRMWVYCAQPKKTNTGAAAGCAPEIASQSPRSNILCEYQPKKMNTGAAAGCAPEIASQSPRSNILCEYQPKKMNTGAAAGCAPEIASQSPRSNILCEYQPTRNGDHAAKFLGDYHGYLVCDGYDGYNKLKNAVRCGCWAHVRRKFVDALPGDRELLATSAAAKGVEYCNRLFLLERKYNGEDEKGNKIAEPLTIEQRYSERQVQSKAVLDAFFAWVEGLTVSGGTKLAKAVSYAKAEKKYLYRFLESGEIPIDNNRAENAVRPFCVGRKNWLFSASVKGAQASAMMYSVAATACANDMIVEQYLTELFRCEAGTVVLPW